MSEGYWSVTITHLDGCVVVDSVEIIDGPPVIDSSFVNFLSCYSIDDGSIDLFPSDTVFTTYSWSNGSTDNSISNLPAGNYSVAVDNLNCYDSLFFSVESPDSIFISLNIQDLLCYNDSSGQLSINSFGEYPIDFFNVNNLNFTNSLITNLSAGSYTVYSQDSTGCYSDTLDVLITQPDSIGLSFITSPETVSFDGSAEVVVSGGVGSFNYSWSNGLNNSTITNLESGFYSVTVVDGNGCAVNDSIFVSSVVNVSYLSPTTFNLFPNPATNYFMIQTNQIVEFNVQIFNSIGAEIYFSENNINSKKININHLPIGIYQVLVRLKSQFSLFTLIVN